MSDDEGECEAAYPVNGTAVEVPRLLNREPRHQGRFLGFVARMLHVLVTGGLGGLGSLTAEVLGHRNAMSTDYGISVVSRSARRAVPLGVSGQTPHRSFLAAERAIIKCDIAD